MKRALMDSIEFCVYFIELLNCVKGDHYGKSIQISLQSTTDGALD